LSGADLQALAREMASLNEGLPGELSKPDFAMLAITAGGLGVYPRAKPYLAERGVASDELEAMPMAEVLIRFVRDSYEVQRDNLFKWFSLPYTQAHAGLARAESEMLEAVERDPIGNFLARLTLPALSRASLRFAELDRRFALLRSLEAVRMHATAERRLPESLADIVKVPVPNDPITARPFPYRLRGNVGLFELEPVPGGKPPAGTVYELELRQ
jgi:hypothetical protein